MWFFTKLKYEFLAVVLIILALIVFGIYIKVKSVQQVMLAEQQLEVSQQMGETLEGIRGELGDIAIQLCLTRAGDDEGKLAECQ